MLGILIEGLTKWWAHGGLHRLAVIWTAFLYISLLVFVIVCIKNRWKQFLFEFRAWRKR